ncbi:MAG TPA: universal stress protein [Candidatus Dormibacteraeota bacterium]|nr:universal stress protein [Candidatus Dormibacteraeota bacterium]
MKILLAVDDSKYSDTALESLMNQVPPAHADVRVLHVVDVTLGDYQSQDVLEGAHQAKLSYAHELVNRYARKLKEAGYAAQPLVKQGGPQETIVEFAEQWHPDLIFLGSHGRRGWKRLTLGSVSEAVAHHVHCSVVIARPQQHG